MIRQSEMDWWASPQTVGVSAVVAAGALVVGGIAARLREARAVEELEPPPSSSSVPAPGPRVMVVGVMKVEGLCCTRFEDAMPVAASTFHEPRGDQDEPSRTWSSQAKNLWVEVGKVRIALQGPVRVEVGSEEHYPGCATDELEGRVVQRIFASRIVPSRDDVVPLHGVFRSVKPDDQVAVVGRMERGTEGKGRKKTAVWRLTPDASGAITICYRRRPTVRGALFGVHAWAAALVAAFVPR